MRKSENEGKSTLDCLDIFINNLRHLQHGLDSQLQTELFMQNHLITACEEVPACRFACYKFNATLAGQITDLKNSISTYEKTHPKYATDTYFIDRRYHGRPFSSRPQQRYLDRPPDDSDRSFIPYRPPANRKKKGFKPDLRSDPGDDDEDDDLNERMEAIILNEISEMRKNA